MHGTLLNRDQSPRTTYVVKTPAGGEVTLQADQVKKVAKQSAAEINYDQIRHKATDTVTDQWKLAEWCREHRLLKQRRTHLERIIELDPNHAEVRHGLGYSQVQGQWLTQEALMTQNGYLRYKGAWLLPQEIEIKESERKEKLAQLEWGPKLKRWHRWLDTPKADEAIALIQAIDDPHAGDALVRLLTDAKDPSPRRVRLLYVEALGRLQASAGMDALVNTSLYDADEEVRLSCLDEIVDHGYKPAVARYVKALKDKDNVVINRAGIALGQLKDPAAVGPLIDALVTVHSFKIQKGQPGQTSASFGSGAGGPGGGGFTFGGGGVETVKQSLQNREVLAALVSLTGMGFDFDERAWKKWYAAQRKPSSLDARRDDSSS